MEPTGRHIDTKLKLVMMDDGEWTQFNFSEYKNPLDEMWCVISVVNNMESNDMGRYTTEQDRKNNILHVGKICH